jgi:hypothetical protein
LVFLDFGKERQINAIEKKDNKQWKMGMNRNSHKTQQLVLVFLRSGKVATRKLSVFI